MPTTLYPSRRPRATDDALRVPVEPFAAWMQARLAEMTVMDLAARLGMHERQVRTVLARTYPHVHIDVVDRALLHYAGPYTLDDLYPVQDVGGLAA